MMKYIHQFSEWNKQQAQIPQNNPFPQSQQPVQPPPFDPRRQDADYLNHLDYILGNQAVRNYATNNEILGFAEGWANKLSKY